MLPRERNYSVVKKECLAIKWAIHSLRYYLLGCSFDLVTDHAPHKWLSTVKDSNARITRWYLALQPFMFHMVHHERKDHQNADYFSQDGGVMGKIDSAECSFGSTLSGGICDRNIMILGSKSPSRPVRALSSESRVLWTGWPDSSFPGPGSRSVWKKARLCCRNVLTRKGNNIAAADCRDICTRYQGVMCDSIKRDGESQSTPSLGLKV
ncbi:UNVERIFIED_CONTAM: hypothetical protein FKN15_005168 [Acipenser sinensis]